MEDSKEFVKIYCCGDCCNYNRKKHMCMVGATEEGEAKDSFYRDCPLGIHEEPHWIPVSERLPEKDGRYQVTRHDYVTNTEFIDILWYEEKLWWNRHSTGNYAVTAWMPLPKLYGVNEE